jgi:hypothetical protein
VATETNSASARPYCNPHNERAWAVSAVNDRQLTIEMAVKRRCPAAGLHQSEQGCTGSQDYQTLLEVRGLTYSMDYAAGLTTMR